MNIGKLRLCGTNGVGYKKKKTYSEELMPTWVPDLRPLRYPEQTIIDPSSNNLEEFGGCESIERLRRTGSCQVHSAGDSEPCFSIYNESLILEAEGVAIDHIEAFEAPGYSFDPSTDGVASQIRWHKLVRNHCHVPHPTGLPRWQAYFRTLILDNDRLLSERAAGFLASFEFASSEQSLSVERDANDHWYFKDGQFRSRTDEAWHHILKFMLDVKLKWLVGFLMVSGEITLMVPGEIDSLGDGRQDGSIPPLSTRMLLHGFYGPLAQLLVQV